MKPTKQFFLGIVLAVTLSGCAVMDLQPSTLQDAYPKMYDSTPASILILPPINNTTAADAKEYFACSLSEAVGLKGYYIFPVEAVFDILRDEGYYDTETLTPGILANLNKHFGADAVLFSTIEKWDKSWFLVSGSLTVEANFALVRTVQADTLWDYSITTTINLGSDSKTLLGMAIDSALKTAMEDYFPNARLANIQTFREALPYGKHHPDFGTDGQNPIPIDKHDYISIDK